MMPTKMQFWVPTVTASLLAVVAVTFIVVGVAAVVTVEVALSTNKKDVVGDGRLCHRCRHLANWTKQASSVILTHSLYYVKTWRHPQNRKYVTKPRPATSNTYWKFGKIWTRVLWGMTADRQANIQTGWLQYFADEVNILCALKTVHTTRYLLSRNSSNRHNAHWRLATGMALSVLPSGKSCWVCVGRQIKVRKKMGQTDGRQTDALRLLLDAARVDRFFLLLWQLNSWNHTCKRHKGEM